MTMKGYDKNGCLTPIILLIIGIVCLIIGLEFDIPMIKCLSYMFPAYAGAMYTELTKGEKWSWKRHAPYILIALIASVVVSYIFYGRVW